MKKYIKLFEEYINGNVIKNFEYEFIENEKYLPIGLSHDNHGDIDITILNKQHKYMLTVSELDSDTDDDLLDYYDDLEDADIIGSYDYNDTNYNITTAIGAFVDEENIDNLFSGTQYPLIDLDVLKYVVLSKDETMYTALTNVLKVEKNNYECYLQLLEFKHTQSIDESYMKDMMISNTIDLLTTDIGYDNNKLSNDILSYAISKNIDIGLSDDVKDIGRTALKGNHKLK